MSDFDGGTLPPAPSSAPSSAQAGRPAPPPPPRLSPPPGYVAYGANAQGAFAAFQRIGGLGRWLAITMMILIPVQALSVLKSVGDRGKAREFLNETITEDDYTSSIGLSALLGIVSFAVFLAVAVLTILWMFRMAKNAQVMGRIGTWKPLWAIGGWFVPPFVLYLAPFLMLRDLWKASDPESAGDWRTNPVGSIVNIWWVLYGLAPLLFLSVTFSSFQLNRSALDAAKEIDDAFTLCCRAWCRSPGPSRSCSSSVNSPTVTAARSTSRHDLPRSPRQGRRPPPRRAR